MKYLKISLTVFVLGLFCTTGALAQIDNVPADQSVLEQTRFDKKGQRANNRANRTPAERAQKQTDLLTKQLELTEEQAAKVNAINLKYANRAEIERSQRLALMSERELEIKEILTEEQAVKMDEKKAKMKEKRKAKRGKKGMKRGQRRTTDELQQD